MAKKEKVPGADLAKKIIKSLRESIRDQKYFLKNKFSVLNSGEIYGRIRAYEDVIKEIKENFGLR